MKYIRVASDLHLEGYYGMPPERLADKFLASDDRDSESVLVLAGDISSKIDQLFEFIAQVEDRFERVVYVPGNHEFYGKEMRYWNEETIKQFSQLQNTFTPFRGVDKVIIDGVRFVVGTLWGECSVDPGIAAVTARSIADFHYIFNDGKILKINDMMTIASDHRAAMRQILWDDFDGKTVAVTHHLPSYELVADRFKMSAINGAFVNPIDEDLEKEFAPCLWIHGHTHSTIDKHIPIKNGTMRVVCNPCGYRHETGELDNEYQPTFINVSEL